MQEQHAALVADLTQCDREPIQVPGSIQPHGILLVLQEPDFVILQVSATTQEILGIPPENLLHASLGVILAADQMVSFKTSLTRATLGNDPLYLFTMKLKGQKHLFDGIAHRNNGFLILELECAPEVASFQAKQQFSPEIFHSIQSAFTRLHQAATVTGYSQMIAEQVRDLTGFDRVMVYRFEEDGHGVVIAEDKRDDLETYLHLHYPASDIPQQARRLYLLNWLRLIVDVNYQPAPIMPELNPSTGKILNMSYAVLRSVSPVHVQYLKNMGVQASMSISIVRNDKLWGLIACHHMTPHFVSYGLRCACEILGRAMSLQLSNVEAQEDAGAIIQMQKIQSNLIELLSGDEPLTSSLTSHQPGILDLVSASGAAVCVNDEIYEVGQTPPAIAIKKILDWILKQPERELFSTSSLTRFYPKARTWRKDASGVMALILSKSHRQAIIWFRPEVIQTIQWAGNPDKPVEVDGQKDLSPRNSFEAWKQTMEGTSHPWKHSEIDAVRNFRNAFFNVVLHKSEELARVNAELAQSNAQLDIFADITSHDLKEPLRGIHNYAHFLIEDYPIGVPLDEEGIAKLQTLIILTQRMEDLINSLLHYSRLGRTELVLQETDLNEVVHQALEMLHLRLRETGTRVKRPASLPVIFCDRVSVGEVFYNLLSNAMKYNDKAEKYVEIGFIPSGKPGKAPPTFYVRDNGIGIAPEYYESIFRMFKRLHERSEYGSGTGVGLTIVRKIVERHGGKIWLESEEGKGTTFYFTLSPEME